jgi:RNA polymerase sigma-70 factor (sigma-E family)
LALLRFCVLLTGRREMAEDLAQESFIRVAHRLAELPVGGVGPYLRRTAVNLWRKRLRRLGAESRALVRRGLAHSTQDPTEHQIEHDRIWSAVRRLPSRQRACVALRYYEDLPEREVAEILGCSVGTVKSQTSRALDKLRKELGYEP